ncbi:MAG: VanW family protein [Acidimicrobiales bacterium]|nr:VanW family protein [Acidimicrobiales bacterium]
MAPRRRFLWAGVLAPIVLLLAVVAAWAIDTGAAGGEVLRNVEVAGIDIGGLASDELLEQVESLDDASRGRDIRIETPEVTYETTADELGLRVDVEATAQAALDEGRTAILPVRPLGWLASFFRPHETAVRYVVDPEQARSTLRRLEGDALVSPVEPTIESIGGDPFTVVPGRPGAGIDPDTLAIALRAAAEDTPVGDPVTVQVRQSDLSPRLSDEDADAAAERANELTQDTMSITAGGVTFQLVPRELRGLAETQEREDTLTIRLDPEKLLPVLAEEFDELEVDAQDAGFTLEGGRPVITPSVTGLSCCDLNNVETINAALAAGEDAVTVELAEDVPALTTEEAEALGIIEEVGSPTEFGPTTNHACCQGRVTNIHRMADIVRGAVILPGETFSVNGFVGQRTREKGFVEAGVIYDGVVTADVGGGVSQFATTLFNAALFAGLDFGEYQSHSLYISRYPRGHEATISWEHPDLQIVNNTEYGVMIWPTYTDTSLTVHLYSTDHIDVAIGEPSSAPSGNCTRWTTPRSRTYPDGSTDNDTVSARYRPAEGVNC